jgi:hypothetical protein
MGFFLQALILFRRKSMRCLNQARPEALAYKLQPGMVSKADDFNISILNKNVKINCLNDRYPSAQFQWSQTTCGRSAHGSSPAARRGPSRATFRGQGSGK